MAQNRRITEIDNSMLDDFKRCPRYFQLRHIEGLDHKSDAAKCKAEFGSALHSGLEEWFRSGNIEEAITKFVEHWHKYEGLDNTGIRTMAKGVIILEQYAKQYPREEEQFTPEFQEVGGSIQILDKILLFKADGVVRRKDNNELIVIDHKSSAHRGFLTTKPNSQLDTYIYALREMLGEPIKAALLDQIYFRKGRANEDQRQTVSFVREETKREDIELQDWYLDVKYTLSFIDFCVHQGYFPKSTKQCTAYGGCMFRDVCSVPPGPAQDSIKESSYEYKPWRPFEDLPISNNTILSTKRKETE